MNKERIQQLRDHLAKLPPEKFDLSVWLSTDGQFGELNTHCGTAGCIAGHALALWAPEKENGMFALIKDSAADVLGLDHWQADALFTPTAAQSIVLSDEIPVEREEVTLEQAVKVLDHLLETGEVDWRVAFP